jgi:hypothetical protein
MFVCFLGLMSSCSQVSNWKIHLSSKTEQIYYKNTTGKRVNALEVG